jgi:hypothetical protein
MNLTLLHLKRRNLGFVTNGWMDCGVLLDVRPGKVVVAREKNRRYSVLLGKAVGIGGMRLPGVIPLLFLLRCWHAFMFRSLGGGIRKRLGLA